MTQLSTNVGNVTGAPELRFTPGGQPVVSFTVAVNERYRDKDGAWQDGDTYFLRCTAWGDLAEHIAASVNRGSRVIVTGKHRSRKYDHTDKTTGETSERYSHDFLVDECGASMRWNDVKIIRADRSTGSTPDAAGAESTWATEPALAGAESPF